ncbi:MAG: DNA-directed RNA polymerase subunit D [Candidatus Micrarchaeia archaeon]
MKISVQEEEKEKLSFTLSKASTSFANLVRRFAMSQVPTFAIDKVTFYENSSTMFDDYLAHRIGLLPLKAGSSVRDDEDVMFSLDVSGPAMIYSSALKSTVDKVKVATDNMPLLRLLENQNLRLEAKAISGIGRKHAKWQAGLCAYEIVGEDEFKFQVESFMQHSPWEMLNTTADILSKKCADMSKELKTLKKAAK